MSWTAILLSTLLGLRANARIASVSRTLFINDTPYYLPAEPLFTFGPDALNVTADALPFTVLTDFTKESSIKSTIAEWEAVDDIFNQDFMKSE